MHYNKYSTSISIMSVCTIVEIDCSITVWFNIEMIHELVWQPHRVSLWGLSLYDIRPPCPDDGMMVVAL